MKSGKNPTVSKTVGFSAFCTAYSSGSTESRRISDMGSCGSFGRDFLLCATGSQAQNQRQDQQQRNDLFVSSSKFEK